MRACSSGKVFSLSSNLGISAPDRRAAAPLMLLGAICTCAVKGSIAGYRREVRKAFGSIFFASQCASALAITACRFLSIERYGVTVAAYMDRDMTVSGLWLDGGGRHWSAARPFVLALP